MEAYDVLSHNLVNRIAARLGNDRHPKRRREIEVPFREALYSSNYRTITWRCTAPTSSTHARHRG
jgi:hypothetical protein